MPSVGGRRADPGVVAWMAPSSEAELREALAEPEPPEAPVEPQLREPGAAPVQGAVRGRLATGGGEDRVRTAPAKTHIDVFSLEAPRFAGVVEYEPKDLTITVGAGTRLDALQNTLGAEGQWLPPSLGPHRSVGGLVGAATPGPFDAAFGSVRRHVLAVRTIAWDGRPLNWGRAVVKNVAGYDMQGLWCGSRGRLGVVTRASLRVWPQPENREWLEVRGSPDGWTLLGSLAEMDPVEDFRPDASLWHSRSGRGAFGLVGFLGSAASVRARGSLARAWAARHGYEIGQREGGETSTVPPAQPAPFEPRSLDGVSYRIHCPATEVGTVGRRLGRALADVPATLDALPGLGVLTVSYSRPRETARAAVLRAALFQAAGNARITMERGGPAELLAAEERRAPGVRALETTVLGALGGAARHWLADFV